MTQQAGGRIVIEHTEKAVSVTLADNQGRLVVLSCFGPTPHSMTTNTECFEVLGGVPIRGSCSPTGWGD